MLVTLNYRLGRFGFFAHPALTRSNPEGGLADYGLMDQIAALKWVQGQYRRLRRRSGQCHHLRRIRRRHVSELSSGLAPGQGPVRQGHLRVRLRAQHRPAARRGRTRRRRPDRRPGDHRRRRGGGGGHAGAAGQRPVGPDRQPARRQRAPADHRRGGRRPDRGRGLRQGRTGARAAADRRQQLRGQSVPRTAGPSPGGDRPGRERRPTGPSPCSATAIR